MLMYRKISHSSHPPTHPAPPTSTSIDQNDVGADADAGVDVGVDTAVSEVPVLIAHSAGSAALPSIPTLIAPPTPPSISSTEPHIILMSAASSVLEPPLPLPLLPALPATALPPVGTTSLPEATESAIFSGVFPLDSDIPQYIRDDVIKMEEEAVEKQRKIEATRNKLELKVFWKNSEKTVFISRRQTLHELFQTIWYQFALADEEDFATTGREEEEEEADTDPTSSVDVDEMKVINDKDKDKEEDLIGIGIGIGIVRDAEEKGKQSVLGNDVKEEREVKEEKDTREDKEIDMDNKGVVDVREGTEEESAPKQSEDVDLFRSYLFSDEAAKQMRLRFYNMSSKVATDVFDFSSLTKTLDTLNFSSYRYLILETRKETDFFPVYFSDGFDVLLEEFDSDLKEFKEARTVRLPKEGTLLNLKGSVIILYCTILYYTIL